jgi:hypothetical protein
MCYQGLLRWLPVLEGVDSSDFATLQHQVLAWSSHLSGEAERMFSQELRCPFRVPPFERLKDRLMELSYLHHIEFFGGEEDSSSNLETKSFPSAEKERILRRFDD